MKCPFCNHEETKVVDKRLADDGRNRRRRECISCGKRFTTYEKPEGLLTKVIKRDGASVDFDKEKIVNAIWAAAQSVGGQDRETAEHVADKVVQKLEEKFGGVTIPTVEQIQDIVEKTLVEDGHYKTAKAYILYREQHKKIREGKSVMVDVVNTIGEYLDQTDWRVKENSNEAFSFSGLLLHTAGKVMSYYNLTQMYTPEIAEAHRQGYFHIHDLSHGVIGYCCGHSLKNLLVMGFGGVRNKTECKPAKHLSTVVHQMVNYIGCLQMEFAGAQAFSSVDTLLAPFIRQDGLSYKEVKQSMQQLVFSLNIPSRWGCFSDDTEILTRDGWKNGLELEIGDIIATFNPKSEKIEYLPVLKMTKDHYTGKMISLKNRITDQLVTPNHRVLRRIHNYQEGVSPSKYVFEEASKLKTKIPLIPLGGNFEGMDMSEDKVNLLSWIVSEGSLCEGERIAIHQSAEVNPENCEEIRGVLGRLGIPFDESLKESGFTGRRDCVRFLAHQRERLQRASSRSKLQDRLNRPESRSIYSQFFPGHRKIIPRMLGDISTGQSRTFLDTYMKADGWAPEHKIYTKKKEDADMMQEMIAKAGWGSTLSLNKNGMYVVRVIKHNYTQVDDIGEVDYDGMVWCPTTANGTVVARRNGKVFISGNSQYPFSNLSFDWVPPLDLRSQKAIVGGREMAYTYGDLQKEMDMINKAFLEVMLEGDAKGGVFTFPIPTYNITKDFDWDSENANLLFDLTAKYGLPYFQNYVGSGLDPRSIRAMCLHPEESIVVRANGRITKTNIGEFAKSHSSGFDAEGWSIPDSYVEAMSLNSETMKLEWKPIKNIVRSPTKSMISIKARDGKRIRVSPNHPVSVLTPDGIIEKPACSISVGDFIISMKSGAGCLSADRQKTGSFELDEDMAMLLGFFIADGNFLFENRKEMAAYGKERGIQLTFPGNCDYASETISLFERKLGTKARLKNDPRYGTLYAYFYNAKVSRELSAAGLKKHGGVPPQIWNSPEGVIRAFLDGFFLGDGYEKRGEIHINDEKLAEELVMLYHMVGQPVTFRKLERSQVITLQHSKERKSSGLMGNPSLSQRVPSWGVNTAKVPGLTHNRCVNLLTLEHYGAHTELTRALMTAEVYPVRVTGVELVDLDAEEYFYDIEMEENHRFVHSLGTVTHNCCRLNLNQKELMSRPGGMWGPGDSTGSIGVVTINVNRLAYEARKAAEGMKTDDLSAKARENYFEKLKYFMVLAKNSLEVKREVVEKNLAGGLMPYTKRYLGTFKNHFSTIGICGMNEACLNLLGKDIASAEGKQLAIDTLKFMREMCLQFQNDTKSLYNLEATPAESTAYRFARLDRKMYPDIITSGRKEPYLTNSTQLPVDYGEDAVMAIEHQNDIQPLYTGGTIFHLFLGERMTSGEACKKLVRKICENTRLPYFSITPTFSICPEHGYIRGEHFTCPMEAEDSDESVELAKAR